MNRLPKLLLASGSPRRRQLLALGNWMIRNTTAEVDETLNPGEEAGHYVVRLAEAKARAGAAKIGCVWKKGVQTSVCIAD